ncbi:hypothetical protein [Legionella brunensis]|uniref:Uncharacterized protein n=1 Tax=Legionella brunensis TaxID=29422 RepID=A0A0W0SV00_9GAMM|nr:hypothetical protein [Legionella brunensis]KTC87195.1 hypothetical protein Lbru_0013 [Legionella brunensis]
MKIYAYVDGQLKFNLDIPVPFEKLNNSGKDYYGIKGSQELLIVYKQVEEQLNKLFTPNESVPPLEQLNLDEINLNDYLIKKYPQLQQLELRANDDSYYSSTKDLFGKQYGYPLVWLNCNKYNHYVTSDSKNHQWERCIYGSKLNSLDKIGSLISYFKENKEDSFYQNSVWINNLKNSFTDNLLIQNRKGSNVSAQIAQMEDFQSEKNFALYENKDKNQITYITSNFQTALKDCLGQLDGSKTVKILFPIDVSNEKYAHVIMGSITLTKPEDITQCNITIYDALTSDPFAAQEKKELAIIQEQVAEIFQQQAPNIQFTTTTGIHNMKYQLPLQTHCGRFVMTWMAAEVAGLDIKKLSNYYEPFNYIFGQTAKNEMSFDSSYSRNAPDVALINFKKELEVFLSERTLEFSKQWTSKGKEDLDITRTLLDLISNIEQHGNILVSQELIKKLATLSPYVDNNLKLKNIIDSGMANLGLGSLNSFLSQAQSPDFKFSARTNIALQYQELDKRIEERQKDLLMSFDDEEEEFRDKNELEDEFDFIDITEDQLASDIRPSKKLEEQVRLTTQSLDNQEDKKESKENLGKTNQTPIPVK